MRKTIGLALCSSIGLSGCALFGPKFDQAKELLNPEQIHDQTAFNKNSDAYRASQIPVADYYAALSLAKPQIQLAADGKTVTGMTNSSSAAIAAYVDAGIGLVDSYCLRWFQTIGELNRLATYQQSNANVISQLGTAVLGIAEANSIIVAAYGAANTAYAGLAQNFTSAFLFSPTSSQVYDKIYSAMSTQAKALRKTNAPSSFTEAYSALEQYADLCTYDAAQTIIKGALDQTDVSVNANGTLKVSPKQ